MRGRSSRAWIGWERYLGRLTREEAQGLTRFVSSNEGRQGLTIPSRPIPQGPTGPSSSMSTLFRRRCAAA
jgi:hypothetical protein